MNFRLITTTLLLFLFLSQTAIAQKHGEETRKAMDRFSMIEGEWEGVALHYNREGDVDTIYQHEDVRMLLGGAILNIEGIGEDAEGKVVFNAFATIFYDAKTSEYGMSAYRGNGKKTDADLEFTGPESFMWSFSPNANNPNSIIRYEASVTDETWKEEGSFSRDKGKTWSKVFSMSLERVEEEETEEEK